MKNNKTYDANQPWTPSYWVVDGKPIHVDTFENDSRRKYAIVKTIAAIMKASRHEN